MAKKQIYLWDDESGEPPPFTPEEVDARLNAALDRREQENEVLATQQREMDALLTRQEEIVANLRATFASSMQALRSTL